MEYMDHHLARRLERADANCTYEFVTTRLASDSGFDGAALEIGGGYALYSGLTSPMNFAVGVGLDGEVNEDEISLIEAFYDARTLAASFKLSPLADHSLWKHLYGRKYAIADFTNAWILHLRNWRNPEGVGQDRQSVVVERVGHELTELWANTVYSGFFGKPPTTDNNAFSLGFYNSPSVTAFLSFVDGQAAAAGSVSICEGVAYLFSTSTLKAFRGHGCQQALIQQRLTFAQAMGCDIAMVQAAPGSASQRNIERAGFRLAYTKVMVSQGH